MTHLQTIPVDTQNLSQFIDYCSLYGREHDESYLPGNDFVLSSDQPSFLLMFENKVIGAVSLLRTKSFLEAKKGRFAIFHSQISTLDAYTTLLKTIVPYYSGLDQVYLFIPGGKQDIADILNKLGFNPERTAYVLCLEEPKMVKIDLPDGYSIQPVSPEDNAALAALVQLINLNFNDDAGQIKLTLAEAKYWFLQETYVPKGICLLYFQQEPVGSICVIRDDIIEDEAVIEFLCVSHIHRGKGLGHNLLRWGINIAVSNYLKPLYLSVRGENEAAIRLYLSQGFRLEDSRICYSKQTLPQDLPTVSISSLTI